MAEEVTLFQFPPAFGLSISVSAYCAKVELYLSLTKRDYRAVSGDLRKSPNKRLPYVRWPDGEIQAESQDIIDRLEREGPSLDEGMSDDDRALGAKLQVLAQGPLYYAVLYARFVEEEGWQHTKPTVRALVPGFVAPILVPLIRRSQVKACQQNGFKDEVGYDATVRAVAEISEAMGDNQFLLGDQPRTADCAVWANLTEVSHTKSDNIGRRAVRKDERLMAYVHRVAAHVGWTLPEIKD